MFLMFQPDQQVKKSMLIAAIYELNKLDDKELAKYLMSLLENLWHDAKIGDLFLTHADSCYFAGSCHARSMIEDQKRIRKQMDFEKETQKKFLESAFRYQPTDEKKAQLAWMQEVADKVLTGMRSEMKVENQELSNNGE